MRIKQGDAYDIEITLTDDDENSVTPDMVKSVEVVIGPLRKEYPGDVYYDYDNDVWIFPLEQEDTFRLSGAHPLRIRVKFTDDTVAGADLDLVVATPGDGEVL